jgi:hypothetical protein
MSERARLVLKSFGDAQEPDVLIFSTLPIACGLPPISSESQASDNIDLPRELRIRLVQVLQEIQSTYENLLIECKSLLHSAFAVSSGENKLREDLRVRASYQLETVSIRFCADLLSQRWKNRKAIEIGSKHWYRSLLTSRRHHGLTKM